MSNFDDTSQATPGAETTYAGPPPLRTPQPPLRSDLASTIPVFERQPPLYIALLSAGLATGLAANLLIAGAPGLGLNLFLVALVFFAGWFLLSRLKQVPLWRKLCALAALTYFFAFAMRASDILGTVNLMLAAGFTALACTAAYSAMRSVWATIVDLLQVGFNSALGAIMVVCEVPWSRMQIDRKNTGVAMRIGFGICIALPFLLVFGLLFSRAEVRFGELFEALSAFISKMLFNNFWAFFWSAFLALGLLRSAFLSISVFGDRPSLLRPNSVLGTIESVTVLSLLNALFLAFVITQVPYLFGGQTRVTNTPDLALSEYARRGFFELAWVAALLIPTLLLFMNFTVTNTPRQLRLIQSLCGGLTLMAALVIASALQRMLLYTHSFGLTELRVYVSVFIVMLALILIMLNVFNIMGRTRLFLPVALIIGFLFSIGIQTVNVQAMVASDIIQRQMTGKRADLNHLNELSADAVSTIKESQLPPADKNKAVETIMTRSLKKQAARNWLYQPLSVVVN